MRERAKRMNKTAVVVCLLAVALSGCATRRIVEVTGNPARFQGRNVRLKGVVTQSAGAIVAGGNEALCLLGGDAE